MILAMISETLPPSQVYEAADEIVAQRLSQIEGVSQVFAGGSESPPCGFKSIPGRWRRPVSGLGRAHSARPDECGLAQRTLEARATHTRCQQRSTV